MPRILRKEGYWWLNYRAADGRQIRKRFSDAKYGGHAAARLAAQQFIEGATTDTGSISDQISLYLNWAESTKAKARSSLTTDRQRLNTFKHWLADRMPEKGAASLTERIVLDFRDHVLASAPLYRDGRSRRPGNRLNTWRRYRDIISAFLSFCVRRGWAEKNFIQKNPVFRERQPLRQDYRYYSRAELQAALTHYSSRPVKHAMFALLIYTGCRLGEAMRLSWRDIDLDRNEITFVHTKTGKPRTVPITPALALPLRALPYRDGYVIGGKDQHIVTPQHWLRLWHRALAAAGYQPGKIHDIRHTAATNMLTAGVDVKTAAYILGNSPQVLLERYAQILDSNKDRAIEAIAAG